MKNLVFFFALLCSPSLVAQFYYNASSQTGIQSATNTASGYSAFAVGNTTTASGTASTAMGGSTVASGTWSTAMGIDTNAQDYISFVVGSHNKTDETPNPTQFSYQNTAFVIGNGGFDSNGIYDGHLSNAFEVLFDGSTTIAGNVTAPAFIGDGSQLTNMPFSFNTSSDTGIQSETNTASGNWSFAVGAGTQASGPASTAMGILTIASGDNSTAMGDNTEASGQQSTAMGWQTTASGSRAIALGGESIASGSHSTAMGYKTIASDYASTAMGEYTTASGPASTAMGSGATASGPASTAMGSGATASGNSSTAMGVETKASGNGATAMGSNTNASGNGATAMGAGTTASGSYSTAMGGLTEARGIYSTTKGFQTIASGYFSSASGAATTADDYSSFAIGSYNKTDETPNPSEFSLLNTAFVIGNGGFDSNGNYLGTDESRSNAFEVLFDGTTTIAGDLNINSDARLKANIISLGATLSKLLQIDGKTYTMKKDANHKKKIGLLAQDIEKVFPELVTETNDIKSVNYQGLVPVLINAMKEQQDEIINQKNEIERLKKQDEINNKQQQEIDELKAMVKALAKG